MRKRIPYRKRVRMYETEKKLLQIRKLTPEEYEEAIKALARKWMI